MGKPCRIVCDVSEQIKAVTRPLTRSQTKQSKRRRSARLRRAASAGRTDAAQTPAVQAHRGGGNRRRARSLPKHRNFPKSTPLQQQQHFAATALTAESSPNTSSSSSAKTPEFIPTVHHLPSFSLYLDLLRLRVDVQPKPKSPVNQMQTSHKFPALPAAQQVTASNPFSVPTQNQGQVHEISMVTRALGQLELNNAGTASVPTAAAARTWNDATTTFSITTSNAWQCLQSPPPPLVIHSRSIETELLASAIENLNRRFDQLEERLSLRLGQSGPRRQQGSSLSSPAPH